MGNNTYDYYYCTVCKCLVDRSKVKTSDNIEDYLVLGSSNDWANCHMCVLVNDPKYVLTIDSKEQLEWIMILYG
jgi:hypothetical protein